MEKYTPRQIPAYPGPVSDLHIRAIFSEAGDFIARELRCGPWTVYAYAIDGLIASAYASDYIFKPITQHLHGETMEQLYQGALSGMIYNNVAKPCEDLDTVALLLVNGFCVVLFPGVGAIAFEVKTGEKRGISAPEVENSVKGPKDAFVETVRSNTSLIRRHLRTPDLRLYGTVVGKRTLTNVAVAWIEGITNPELVERLERLEQICSAQSQSLKLLSEMRSSYPIRTQMEELLKSVQHLEAMAEQAGKKKEKHFSLPRFRLPRLYLPGWEWPTVLTVVWMLAALFLLWFSSVDGWSKLSLMLR